MILLLHTSSEASRVFFGQELTADRIDFDQTTGIGSAVGGVIYYDTTAKNGWSGRYFPSVIEVIDRDIPLE